MAEARSAVSLNFSKRDGKSIDNSRSKCVSILFYVARKYFFQPISVVDRFIDAFTFPCSKASLVTIYSVVILMFSYNKKLCRSLIFSDNFIAGNVLYLLLMPPILWIILAKFLQLLIRTIIFYSIKLFISNNDVKSFKKRLVYGLMFFLTSIVKFLFWRKKHLYFLQNCLPSLPVPALDDTLRNWFRSIKPFKTDIEYLNIVLEAQEFQKKYGTKLQTVLYLKYLLTPNYVTDWWEKYVYLRSRVPLVINSNYYICDTPTLFTSSQSWRCAVAIWSLVTFKREIESESIEPIIYSSVIPLCSKQFSKVFNTTRIPAKDIDTLQHASGKEYMIVWHKGRFFKLDVSEKGNIFSPFYIETILQNILDDTSQPSNEELNLASLTALPRDQWAVIRENHFSAGVNKESLCFIDNAMCFICLDDENIDFSTDENLTYAARKCFHGNGNNIWFDKSFNVISHKNGRIGINVEHSWADAPIMSQCLEYCVGKISNFVLTENNSRTVFNPCHLRKLDWDLSKLETEIGSAYTSCLKIINDCDLQVLNFTDYGKGFIKSVKTSPDSFYQIALQLAYYKDIGCFDNTYESSMTRLFYGGRTETVRSCTAETCLFVQSLTDDNISVDLKRKYFYKAANYHVNLFRKAMMGEGCDRHFFALLVSSKLLGLEIPFLNSIMSESWKLSTSQTPASLDRSGKKIYLTEYGALGGGFGPVADDGYGVAYYVQEDNVIFHVSSKKSSNATSSKRFANNISCALLTLKKLLSS